METIGWWRAQSWGTILTLKETDWKNFFKKNGPGEVQWKKVGPWREQQNCEESVLIVSGQIRGGARGLGWYATYSTDKGKEENRDAVLEAAVNHFESFANPECRCRFGWHWKCSVHGNWRG